jgi:methylthioribose-1-phosphate isomerase
VRRVDVACRPLRREADALVLLDQRRLPERVDEVRCRTAEEVAAAIRDMVVRGAPVIGVAAAHGVALEARAAAGGGMAAVREATFRACDLLAAARPTAVNLALAIERMRGALAEVAAASDASVVVERLDAEARAIEEFEEAASLAMARMGADLVAGHRRPYLHCNTGALATVGPGTAQAVVTELWRRGALERVVVGETRPLLQGARLTAWELARAGVLHVVVVDSLAAALMRRGEVDCVLVGADRIAANGDVANKVGTYALAVHCAHHGLPLYVVAPTTTIDPRCPAGEDIPIEERDRREVAVLGGRVVVPEESPVANPAFDVTPAALVGALITERGVVTPLDAAGLAALLSGVDEKAARSA